MKCSSLSFSGDAIKQMFARSITKDDVQFAIVEGESIMEYPNDQPYPGCLLLSFSDNSPLHVVVARNTEDNSCYVITAYKPSLQLWESDFKTRKKP